jgi:hypothetical protein
MKNDPHKPGYAGDKNFPQIVRTGEQEGKRPAAFLPSVMKEEPQQFQPPTANTTEPGPRCLTITEAADVIGVDTFTMLSFIQRGRMNPTRSPSGEIMVPECELATLMEKGR